MQIFKLAKELKVKSGEIIDYLKSQGRNYSSHMNKLSEIDQEMVQNHFSGKSKKKTGKKKTILRKRKTIVRKKEVSPEKTEEKDASSPQEKEHKEQKSDQKTPAPVQKKKKDKKKKEEIYDLTPEEVAMRELRKHREKELKEDRIKKDAESQEKKVEEKKKSEKKDIEKKEPLQDKKKETESPVKKIKIAEKEEAEERKKRQKSKKADKQKFVKRKIHGGDVKLYKNEFAEDSSAQKKPRKKTKKPKRKKRIAMKPSTKPASAKKRVVKVHGTTTVAELSKEMGVKSRNVQQELIKLGAMLKINDKIDLDTAQLVADNFGYTVKDVEITEDSFIEKYEDSEKSLRPCPPVVTVMGHVDHGKTLLLDTIRDTRVASKEAGGITQHIGAYSIKVRNKHITFLDTPGHEAFTSMRSRGASTTDIVILMVAADDGIMPQTVEAINHAKVADVPIIVAINKIDKPQADPEKVRRQLLKHEIVPEDLGGEHIVVEVSAKEGTNIDELLDYILLQYEILDKKVNPDKPAKGVIIEGRMERGKGVVASVLVKEGTLKKGDFVVAGISSGYVRSMVDWTGSGVDKAEPAFAVEISGLDEVPNAGDMLYVFKDEEKAKGLVDFRKQREKDKKLVQKSGMSLENMLAQVQESGKKEVNVIIKADVDGSVEAIAASLKKIKHENVEMKIIHTGVGGVTERDILLASTSNAIIVGFNVRMNKKARELSKQEQVDVKIFSVIYDLINAVKSAMSGVLDPIVTEELVGKAEVRQVFKISKTGTVAGCIVNEGKMIRNAKVKLIRDNVVIYEGAMDSLKRFKQDAKEVKNGYECGISIEKFNDIKEGDEIECYIDKETKDEIV
ncbi:MAG: translation initiation factor IF-2 [bacterium]